MSIEALYPFAGDNAIQNVAFALEWPEELTNSDLLAVRATYDQDQEFKRAYPQVQQPPLLMINVTDPQAAPKTGSEFGAVNFLRPHPSMLGAASRAINVTRASCVAIVSDYSRWDQVWTETRRWLLKIASAITRTRPISLVGLQYTDVFQWRADPATLHLNEVLLEGSDLLVRNVFKTKNLWHSHHGYFEDREEPMPHQLLENVNVSVTDNNGRRSIQIVTVHRAGLRAPIWNADELAGTLDRIMNDLHQRNKAVMGNVLTPEVQQKIKLNG